MAEKGESVWIRVRNPSSIVYWTAIRDNSAGKGSYGCSINSLAASTVKSIRQFCVWLYVRMQKVWKFNAYQTNHYESTKITWRFARLTFDWYNYLPLLLLLFLKKIQKQASVQASFFFLFSVAYLPWLRGAFIKCSQDVLLCHESLCCIWHNALIARGLLIARSSDVDSSWDGDDIVMYILTHIIHQRPRVFKCDAVKPLRVF